MQNLKIFFIENVGIDIIFILYELKILIFEKINSPHFFNEKNKFSTST